MSVHSTAATCELWFGVCPHISREQQAAIENTPEWLLWHSEALARCRCDEEAPSLASLIPSVHDEPRG